MWFCSPVLASGTAVAAGEEGGVGATADGSGQPPVAFEPEVRGSDVAVFVAGVIPFAWATGSFWTRVLKGEVFGTGRDRVVFDQPFSDNGAKPGARKLTSAALNVSYALFIIAGGSLALALVAFLQAK
ncbi:hypothetical protein HOP50_03g20940 [Chloropicon primus]|nr:hypothetical protein HOP50_03g20940 [Chloropicon primus]